MKHVFVRSLGMITIVTTTFMPGMNNKRVIPLNTSVLGGQKTPTTYFSPRLLVVANEAVERVKDSSDPEDREKLKQKITKEEIYHRIKPNDTMEPNDTRIKRSMSLSSPLSPRSLRPANDSIVDDGEEEDC